MGSQPRVLGIAGHSGSGKTALLRQLIALFAARGLRVATIKHAHHDFDIDVPGKDSWEHRRAGAREVIVASGRRWAQIHEIDGVEPTLAQLLQQLPPCDLIFIEGYKREPCPRLEVHRAAAGNAPLYPADRFVLAVATDSPLPPGHPPTVDLNDIPSVAQVAFDLAVPLSQVLAQLQRGASPA